MSSLPYISDCTLLASGIYLSGFSWMWGVTSFFFSNDDFFTHISRKDDTEAPKAKEVMAKIVGLFLSADAKSHTACAISLLQEAFSMVIPTGDPHKFNS